MDWSQYLTKPLNRRQFLERSALLGLSGITAGTLAACTGSPFLSGNTVAYWNLFGGGDGARMIQMEQAFQQQYPADDVRAVTLSWGSPYYTKLAMATVGNSPPNIAIMHLSRMPTYAAANLLDPIDVSELEKYGVTENDFLPAVWTRAQFNGTNYAVPLDTHPFVMYYNTDICKKAGLLDSSGNLKPLQGPNDFIDAFQRTQKVTGAYGLSVAVQDSTVWRLFNSLYGQLGGSVLSPDGKQYVLNESHAEQALSFMSDLSLKYKVANPNIDYAGSVALFSSGKAGFLWDGEWEVTTYQGTLPFNMVPFPNIFGGQQTWADSHSFIFPRGSTADPTAKAIAYRFVATMLKQSLTWAKGGHIPAYLPVTQSAEYKALKPQSNYASDAGVAVLDPTAWFSGAGSQFETDAQNAFSLAMSGQASVVGSLQEFHNSIQKLLNQPVPLPTSV
ncbi:MAG TPA: ABC transporter substrate-binding protein [Ktedonobacter sp.]|nr:ABC transporter substrate-binding protein [Ktedonobacter sp.]